MKTVGFSPRKGGIFVLKKRTANRMLLVRHCRHDEKVSRQLLSSLRPSGRVEAVLLARMDLGTLAVSVLWHSFAFRPTQALEVGFANVDVRCVDAGDCNVVHLFTSLSVDLGDSIFSHLYCGFYFYPFSLP
jgi:hypothetical protein